MSTNRCAEDYKAGCLAALCLLLPMSKAAETKQDILLLRHFSKKKNLFFFPKAFSFLPHVPNNSFISSFPLGSVSSSAALQRVKIAHT